MEKSQQAPRWQLPLAYVVSIAVPTFLFYLFGGQVSHLSAEDFTTFVYVYIATGVFAFVALQFVNAPYGKFMSEKWGPTIPDKVGWVFMEAPSPVLTFLFWFHSGRRDIVSAYFVSFWLFHYIYRAFIYPLRLSSSGKQMSAITSILAFFFNLMNPTVNSVFLYYQHQYSADWVLDPAFVVGTVLFIGGWLINYEADGILRNLRSKDDPKAPPQYHIPYGGFFDYVTCANYWGELVEWLGWAILTWSFTGACFWVWTMCNLVPRAAAQHRWYQSKFGAKYPPQRTRIVPFLY